MQIVKDYCLNKFIKAIIWVITIGLGLLLVFFALFYYNNYEGKKRMAIDEQNYCKNFEYINEPLSIGFEDFTTSDIDTLACLQIRKNTVLKDTLILPSGSYCIHKTG
jgi:hypothetical protein